MTDVSSRCREYGHHTWRGVRANLARDIDRVLNKNPSQAVPNDFKHRLSAFVTPTILALTLSRLAHWLFVNGWSRLAAMLSVMNQTIHRVNIAPGSCIGPGCFLPHPAGVTFYGSGGEGVTLYSLAVCCPAPGDEFVPERGPHLGDRVILGAHASVIGRVEVGARSLLQFTLRVARDLPADVIAVHRQHITTRHRNS